MTGPRILPYLWALAVCGPLACGSSQTTDPDGSTGGALNGTGGDEAGSGGRSVGSGGRTADGGGPSNATGGAATTSGGQTGSGGEETTGSGGAVEGSGGFTGTCTASQQVQRNVSGSGPHDVVVETNSEEGVREGTIFRPADLEGDQKYPIFVWGQGGCSRNGFDAEAAMAEIASHGYFVVADGDPSGDQPNRDLGGGGDVLLGYVDWVIEENSKPCSAYYQHIETTKVAANGFSCGGLMAADTAADPRMTTWGHTSSGLFSADQAFYDSVHTPVLIITGTADSLGANENGQRDFDNISEREGIPIMMFAKVGADHGGDLWAQNGGHFTRISVAWLNWWLKDDETATGKGMLVGGSCPYCSDNTWIVSSAHLP